MTGNKSGFWSSPAKWLLAAAVAVIAFHAIMVGRGRQRHAPVSINKFANVDGDEYSIVGSSGRGVNVKIRNRTYRASADDIRQNSLNFKDIDTKTLKKYLADNPKDFGMVVQAIEAYVFADEANNPSAIYCGPYYELKKYAAEYKRRFADKKAKAEDILKNVLGEKELSPLRKAVALSMGVKIGLRAADDDYLETQRLMLLEYGRDLSKEEYCRLIDGDAADQVDLQYRQFEQFFPDF